MTGRLGAFLLAIALVAAGTLPAAAHRLKLFVTVEAGEIGGYAFFVGGGRPDGVAFEVHDGAGGVAHRGTTDAEGAFHWRPATAGDYTVVVDTGDGHWAEERVAAERFGAAAQYYLYNPIADAVLLVQRCFWVKSTPHPDYTMRYHIPDNLFAFRSEEHTSELQSH